MSTAIKVFLKQSVKEQRIPFVLGEPLDSFQAREEALERKGKVFDSVDEMMKDTYED